MSHKQFPFAAIQFQDQVKTALLLAAINPQLGGVLIAGPRGTGKSTLARGLAELLPHDGQEGPAPFINLPLGASEEKLTGTLRLDHALQQGEVVFEPGLLARAHGGVLYVDEVNLLADHLVDLTLDAAASGINHVERDGISRNHPARFVLIGTMNPDEGELRPQLLDRFGLYVHLDQRPTPAQRRQIMQTRLAFDQNPDGFRSQWQAAQDDLTRTCTKARKKLAMVTIPDALFDQIAELCHAAQVEGMRADIVMLHAARAHAALHQRDQVDDSDLQAVAELVLAHRRTTPPVNEGSTDDGDAPAPSNGSELPGHQPGHQSDHQPGHQPDQHPDPQSDPNQTHSQTSSDWGAMPPVAVHSPRPPADALNLPQTDAASQANKRAKKKARLI